MGANVPAADHGPIWGKIFAANYLGLIFEAYDLTIYSLLVVPVSQYFHVPVWYGFLVLTMTYVFRGLGGLWFGHIGDKMGRRNALVLTVLGYSVCTALTGLSWSLGALIVFRGLTGLFIGGEYVGYSYTMEVVPHKSRGGFSGLLVTSYSVGFLLASATFGAVTAIMGPHFAAGGGWRWPFFVGIVPALIALWMRLGIVESPAWVKASQGKKQSGRVPFFEIFKRRYIKRTIHAWLVMAALIWAYDVLLLGLPRLLGLLKVSPGGIAELTFITNVGSLLGSLVGGLVSQRIGRKAALIATAVLGMIATPFFVPIFNPHPGFVYIAIGGFIGAIFAEGGFGIMPAYLSERYPTELRATGSTGTYNLGQIIAGWSTTLMAAMFPGTLIGWEHGMIWNALIGFAVLIVLASFGRETSNVDLDRYDEAAEARSGGIPVGAR